MVTKIISGGQTGADQGGLAGALEAGFLTGGYAPKGFETEKGNNYYLMVHYNLVDSGLDYVGRTKRNVAESDITLWFGHCNTSGYTATKRACFHYGKMFFVVTDKPPKEIAKIMKRHPVVNIAGNRESKYPGLFGIVRDKIKTALLMIKEGTV